MKDDTDVNSPKDLDFEINLQNPSDSTSSSTAVKSQSVPVSQKDYSSV